MRGGPRSIRSRILAVLVCGLSVWVSGIWAQDARVLSLLLDLISAAKERGDVPVVTFDLDDTLLNTAARKNRIIQEFVAQEHVQKAYPKEIARIQKFIESPRWQYDPITTLRRECFLDDEQLLAKLKLFFGDRFFSNDYILEDTATLGASEYVAAVLDRGAVVVYLTGRWKYLSSGTEATLKSRGFPIRDNPRVHLLMKEDSRQQHAEFKGSQLKKISEIGKVIGGFDNDPTDINLLKTYFPDASIIFLDTLYAGKGDSKTDASVQVLPGIPWLKDFVLH